MSPKAPVTNATSNVTGESSTLRTGGRRSPAVEPTLPLSVFTPSTGVVGHLPGSIPTRRGSIQPQTVHWGKQLRGRCLPALVSALTETKKAGTQGTLPDLLRRNSNDHIDHNHTSDESRCFFSPKRMISSEFDQITCLCEK